MAKTWLSPENSFNVEINPMVIGIKNTYCKIDKICAHVATGFGRELQRCKYLTTEGEELYCTALIQEDKKDVKI